MSTKLHQSKINQPKPNVLKTKLAIIHQECDTFLDDCAARIKQKDGQNLPFETIRQILTRSDCRCMAVLRLLSEQEK